MTLQGDLILSLIREGDKISDKSRPLRESQKREDRVKTGQGSLMVGFTCLDVPDFDDLEVSSIGPPMTKSPAGNKLRALLQ